MERGRTAQRNIVRNHFKRMCTGHKIEREGIILK
jgi:hypothetical protein